MSLTLAPMNTNKCPNANDGAGRLSDDPVPFIPAYPIESLGALGAEQLHEIIRSFGDRIDIVRYGEHGSNRLQNLQAHNVHHKCIQNYTLPRYEKMHVRTYNMPCFVCRLSINLKSFPCHVLSHVLRINRIARNP